MDNLKYIYIAIVSADENIDFNVSNEKLEYIEKEYHLGVEYNIYRNNREKLTVLYNRLLERAKNDNTCEMILMMHGDVSFDFVEFIKRYCQIKDKYDIIGFAGTKKIDTGFSPLTWFTGSLGFPEERYGRITHSDIMFSGESFFNMTKPNVLDTNVITIDGLFICINRKVIDSGIRFDERFSFDFYDIDFCFNALLNYKLKIGVMVFPTKHKSVGRSILQTKYLEPEKIFKEKYNLLKSK